MLPDFVDKASTYLLDILRTRYTPRDRVFSRLAIEIGVTPATVQRWYSGSRGNKMPLHHVQGLSRALGVSMEEVATAVGDEGAARLFRLMDREPDVMTLLYEAAERGGESWEKIKSMLVLMKPT
jgi:DNA-binding transcriptional regulator YdaS (Cro superfamily)